MGESSKIIQNFLQCRGNHSFVVIYSPSCTSPYLKKQKGEWTFGFLLGPPPFVKTRKFLLPSFARDGR